MSVNQESTPKIVDFLSPGSIRVGLAATGKKAVLEELVGLLAQEGKINDVAGTLSVLAEREKLGSTGIGQGIAIPHAKSEKAHSVVAAFGLSRRGVAFDALDGEPVHIFFLLVSPPSAAAQHLQILQRISKLLKNKFFRQSLRDVKTPAEVLQLIKQEDAY